MPALFKRLAAAAPVLVAVLGLATATARADRAESPTDGLGAWALESRLVLGAVAEDRVFVVDGVAQTHRANHPSYGLALRLWPAEGVHVGVEQRVAAFSGRDLAFVETLGAGRIGREDLRVSAGFVRRPTPSFIVGGGVAAVAPTGSAIYSREQRDVEGHALVGLSFTPRWDFHVRALLGDCSAPAGDPQTGWRYGFLAGVAYQRPRFFLLLEGFDRQHQAAERTYATSGGGITVGWELRPGLTLALREEGASSGLTRTSSIEGGVALSYVFLPDRREQRLREPDARRGTSWRWWRRWR